MDEMVFEYETSRIEAAGIRVFKKQHIDVLYQELKYIPNEVFHSITTEYLSIESYHPKFVGYFKKSATGFLASHNIRKDNCKVGVPGGEYDFEQQALFLKCVNTATAVLGGITSEYKVWVEWFNAKWLELSGELLTAHLKNQLIVLKLTKK